MSIFTQILSIFGEKKKCVAKHRDGSSIGKQRSFIHFIICYLPVSDHLEHHLIFKKTKVFSHIMTKDIMAQHHGKYDRAQTHTIELNHNTDLFAHSPHPALHISMASISPDSTTVHGSVYQILVRTQST